MKIVAYGLLAALVLMSIAAGGAKLANMPQEIAFFREAGVSALWLVPLGLVQIGGAAASVFARTRVAGLALMAAGFLASSMMVFATGDIRFGALSLIPVVLALALIGWEKRRA